MVLFPGAPEVIHAFSIDWEKAIAGNITDLNEWKVIDNKNKIQAFSFKSI